MTVERVRVTAENQIIGISVTSTSGHPDLDAEAVRAIRNCEVTAGLSNGKPKEKVVALKFNWRHD